MWRAYQKPRNRPTVRQSLDHLRAGGLLGHIPAALGLAVLDVDESDPDGLWEWESRFRPLGSTASEKAGRKHLYYESRPAWRNRNRVQIRTFRMLVDVRSLGMIVMWDPSQVAEIVAQRSMEAKMGKGLPKALLHLTEAPKPIEWGGSPALDRELLPPQPRRTTGAAGTHTWRCPSPPAAMVTTEAGVRNAALFDATRFAAYRMQRGSGGDAVRRRWDALWQEFALQANRMMPQPMNHQEAVKTAASVSKWTWDHPEWGRSGDEGRGSPAVQSERGVMSGEVRRARVRPRNARIVGLRRRDSLSMRAIGRIEGVSACTVFRVLREDAGNPGCFTNQSPPRVHRRSERANREGITNTGIRSARDLGYENRIPLPVQIVGTRRCG